MARCFVILSGPSCVGKGLPVFLFPLSKSEILDLRASYADVDCYVKNLMLHKIAVRARFQGEDLTPAVIAGNRDRAADAPKELRFAHQYTYVLANHDGEGNPNPAYAL